MLSWVSTWAYAATDYNSSRSNTEGVADIPDETEILLEEAKKEALPVFNSMLTADQRRDGYEGEYKVTVKVKVKLERASKREVVEEKAEPSEQ